MQDIEICILWFLGVCMFAFGTLTYLGIIR